MFTLTCTVYIYSHQTSKWFQDFQIFFFTSPKITAEDHGEKKTLTGHRLPASSTDVITSKVKLILHTDKALRSVRPLLSNQCQLTPWLQKDLQLKRKKQKVEDSEEVRERVCGKKLCGTDFEPTDWKFVITEKKES